MKTPEKNDKHELSEQAYRRIRERVLTGEYTFGMVLSRRYLAREFGMSLVPINEAMSRLENELPDREHGPSRLEGDGGCGLRHHLVAARKKCL